MRYVALTIALIGIFVLMLMLQSGGEEVKDIEGLRSKTRVILKGSVENEKIGENYNSFNIGNVSVKCYCKEHFDGKNVGVEGYVEEFNGKRYVRVLNIKIID